MNTKRWLVVLGCFLVLGSLALYNHNTVEDALAQLVVIDRTYTSSADFAEGDKLNVNSDNDQIMLTAQLTTFDFIWIALSGRGTVVKVDTDTGQILGEYRSAPENMGKNPSRTTVDLRGNVWVSNRAETQGSLGSAVHIGLQENSQCVDRNGNGRIDTSTGLGDVKAWQNAGNVDSAGGVSTAEDECIINYVRVSALGTRHVSVDRNNDAWIGGNNNFNAGNRRFDLVDGDTGQVLKSIGPFDCGGYGGLIDRNGIMWSARGDGLLRYDPQTDTHACVQVNESYGLGVDSNGVIWNANWVNNTITKVSPDGTIVDVYPSGGSLSRGVAITPLDDNVWIANSGSDTVTRLDNNGNLLATINVGDTPTGVAVDAKGKVWVTNLDSNSAMRIDPTINDVDLTVDLGAQADPYNYSDMTGGVLFATYPQGSWTVVHDGGAPGYAWERISWTAQESGGSSITVRVRTAETEIDLSKASYVEVDNGVTMTNISNGRFIQIEVVLKPGPNNDSPILEDLSIESRQTSTCKLVQDKTASPALAHIGQAVKVELTLESVGECDAVSSPIDVMLVLDRSGSMNSGRKMEQAQDAAKNFVSNLGSNDQAGIASFASTGASVLDQALTGDKNIVNVAIDNLSPGGATNIAEGLQQAEQELLSNRRQNANAPLMILLSDGKHNESSPDELVNVADAIKTNGIRIITIGLGNAVDENQLKAIASSDNDYYFAPNPQDLASIYSQIAPTTRVAARDVTLVDILSPHVKLIDGSFTGPISPTVQGKEITWRIGGVPADQPLTLGYEVSMTDLAGTWPTNDSAMATYKDPTGQEDILVFPIPQVSVPLVCEKPDITQITPGWVCESEATNLTIQGSSFFRPVGPVSGTFSIDASIGSQAITINTSNKDTITGSLAAGLPIGVHDVTVVNTCSITDITPFTSADPNQPAPNNPIPTKILSDTLQDAFHVLPAPTVLSVRPPEGFESVASELTICGEGFSDPTTEAFIVIEGEEISLLNQATHGDTCLIGTVPSSFDDNRIKAGTFEIRVRGTCGQATGVYTVLPDTLNDDLWSPELWVVGRGSGGPTDESGICVRLNDQIELGAFINRRGGKTPVEDLQVTFYNGDPSGLNPQEIGVGEIPLLPVRVNPAERISGTSTSAVSWQPPQTGEFTIFAIIDSPNSVEEDNETNNIISRTIRVLPPVQLAPGGDGVAPIATNLTIGGDDDIAYQQGITLSVDYKDFAQEGVTATGVYSMHIVELLFSNSAGVWVPVKSSGWLSLDQPSAADDTETQKLPWELSPKGGLRFIQAWVTDQAGNVSRYPFQKRVSYLSSCMPVARDNVVVYRKNLQAGDVLYTEVAPCNGDADLYIWRPDWNSDGDFKAPYVSNFPGSTVDTTPDGGYPVPVDGEYTIEVYGYSNARFSISIDVAPGAAPAPRMSDEAFYANLSPDKPLRTSRANPGDPERTTPVLPPGSQPNITMGVQPPNVADACQGDNPPDVCDVSVGTGIYLPILVK